MAAVKPEKWALILGGSSGMGLATAHKLAREGYHLAVVYRERKGGEERARAEWEKIRQQGGQCLTYNQDALREDSRQEIITDLAAQLGTGRFTLLLHSIARGNLKLMAPYQRVLPEGDTYAATARYLEKEFGDQQQFLREDDFMLTLQAMAVSFYTWVKAVRERGLFAEKAAVLSLTSEGSAKAWRNYAAVGAAKAALESISRAMAVELAPYGLRSNILQPGVTITPSFRMIRGHEQIERESVLRNPCGRLTTPEDVANVVYLMGRPEAAWINGAVIPVDGGESIA